ncbi:MAG: amidohydrolase family protein [Myxococcota bacterium]|nr:amidohydrolase family protein [Myxococcota bacterium]
MHKKKIISLSSVVIPGLLVLLLVSSKTFAADCTLYRNGSIFSARAEKVDASWFVIQSGKFIAIGNNDDDLEPWLKPCLEVDLQGAFVAPGFIDAHIHFVDGGLSLLQTNLGGVTSLDALEQRMKTATKRPIGGWIVARNLGLEPFDGELPTHDVMDPILPQDVPIYIALKGGHHTYVNREALEQMNIERDSTPPPGGDFIRDRTGELTGVLQDEAAFEALRYTHRKIPRSQITEAILKAEKLALSYGMTAIGDNTFFPSHFRRYRKLQRQSKLKLRIMARSYGPMPITEFLMRLMDRDADQRLGYFGAKYFLDGSLQVPENTPRPESPGGEPVYRAREIAEMMEDFGGRGAAWHVQSFKGAARLVDVRLGLGNNVTEESVFVLDHCGSCYGELLEKIAQAGFQVTLLPGQLHVLADLASTYNDSEFNGLLQFDDLFAASIAPALTSDWPYGLDVDYPGFQYETQRIPLCPLSHAAVVTSGQTPDGNPIEGASSRTIDIGRAMLGITRNGARAIGRGDSLGIISPGFEADFVILEGSPFQVDPAALYTMKVIATYIAGECVYHNPAAQAGLPTCDGPKARQSDSDGSGYEENGAKQRHWFASLEGQFTYHYLGGAGELRAWYQGKMFDYESPIAKNFFRLGISQRLSSTSETGVFVTTQIGLPFRLVVDATWVQSLGGGNIGFIHQPGPEADYFHYLPDGPRDTEFSGPAFGGMRLRIKPVVAIGGEICPGNLLAVLYEPVFFFQDLTLGTPDIEKTDWYFDQGEFMNLRARDWVITHDAYAGYVYDGGGWGELAIAAGYEYWRSYHATVGRQRITGRISYEAVTLRTAAIGLMPYFRVRAGGWLRDPVWQGQFHIAGIIGLRWEIY